MGVVVEVEHLEFPRRFALKWIRPDRLGPEAEQRFKREAVVTGSLCHENLVSIVDFGRCDDGAAYMVMELLSGETLAARLRRGSMSIGQIVRVVEQVCAGLCAAHARGVVHRDIKPSNLFCTTRSDGTELIKILDFGVAKALDAPGAILTTTASPVGTAHYMAPEQASGDPIDGRIDVYALGVVAFEALTGGRLPHPGETFAQVMAHLLTKPALSLLELRPDLPPGLAEVVSKALAHERSDRFVDAADFARAIRRFADTSASLDETAPARGEGRLDASDPERCAENAPGAPQTTGGLGRTSDRAAPPRRPWIVPAVGVALLGAAAITGWQLRERRAAPASVAPARAPDPSTPPAPPASPASDAASAASPPTTASSHASPPPPAAADHPSIAAPRPAPHAPAPPPVEVSGRRGSRFDTNNPY